MLTQFIRFLSLLPLMTVVSFGAFICGARYALGQWPVPSLTDPANIKGGVLYDNLYGLLTSSLCLTLLGGPIWLILFGWQWKRSPNTAKRNLFLFAFGWTTLLFVFCANPGRSVEWFLP